MKLRSDNGTEYKNGTVSDYLLEKHVRQEFNSTNTPETNGFAERYIAIDVTQGVAMMAHAGLLKSNPELLVESVRHSIHLNERVMKADSGEELMRIPVFGSVVWVHIPKKERKKHDERANLGLYMGVPIKHGK
jgi:hypothetical protein